MTREPNGSDPSYFKHKRPNNMRVFLVGIVLQYSILEYRFISPFIVGLMQAPTPGTPGADNPAPPPVFGNMDGTVQLQLIILITTLAGFLYNWWRDGRQRRWDLEDRRLAREQALANAQKIHDSMQTAATKAAQAVNVTEHRSNVLEQKIDENTEMTRKAISEANNFNRKLADITARFLSGDGVEVTETTTRAVRAIPSEPTDESDDAKKKPSSRD